MYDNILKIRKVILFYKDVVRLIMDNYLTNQLEIDNDFKIKEIYYMSRYYNNSIHVLIIVLLLLVISCSTDSQIQKKPITRTTDRTPRIVEGTTRNGQTVIHEYYYPSEVDENYAPIVEENGVRFFYPAGRYNEIYIIGDFNNWSKDIKMELKGDVFTALIPLSAGSEYQYKFYTDEGRIHDPNQPDLVYDGLYAANSRISLDSEGNILPIDPHDYFRLRSRLGKLTIYTKTRSLESLKMIDDILFKTVEIANNINKYAGWEAKNSNRQISIYIRFDSYIGGYAAGDQFFILQRSLSNIDYLLITHELIHILSKINDDKMLAEGLAESMMVLVDKPGQKSDNGKQYLIGFIKRYFNKDKYLDPSILNEAGVLIFSDLGDTGFLYQTAGTFFLYLFENYDMEDVISFAANNNPKVLDTTWSELDVKYKEYLTATASKLELELE